MSLFEVSNDLAASMTQESIIPTAVPLDQIDDQFESLNLQDLHPMVGDDISVPRLRVEGSQILDPDGNNFRPVGFNWVMKYVYEGDGKIMKEKLPGANAVRLIGMTWKNSPENPNMECYQD